MVKDVYFILRAVELPLHHTQKHRLTELTPSVYNGPALGPRQLRDKGAAPFKDFRRNISKRTVRNAVTPGNTATDRCGQPRLPLTREEVEQNLVHQHGRKSFGPAVGTPFFPLQSRNAARIQ